MPLTADHFADVAIHTTIAGAAVWQVMGWLMVTEALKALGPPSMKMTAPNAFPTHGG